MPSSTTFVVIVSHFSAVFGGLQDFEKKSFSRMGIEKFWKKNKKMVNPTEMALISKFFS